MCQCSKGRTGDDARSGHSGNGAAAAGTAAASALVLTRDLRLLGSNGDSDDDVGVALKRLHDLPALEVPKVDLVVLGAGDDPLSARDREAGSDAVLLVRVADVRLEAARSLVVPKTDRTVVRSGEDILGVGRELDMLTAWAWRKET